jgi:hypothetical protein
MAAIVTLCSTRAHARCRCQCIVADCRKFQHFPTRAARFIRRERIADANLREAIHRAERGLIDADLGGGLIKQRVARPGQGQSGSYRMIVVYRTQDRAFFVYGFAKSERENIEPDELADLRAIAADLLAANDAGRAQHFSFCLNTVTKGQISLSLAV